MAVAVLRVRSHRPRAAGLAAQLGEAIAGQRVWTLVKGGGNVSATAALATAARARGGWTVGVIPKMSVRREVADHDADELIVTDTMRERKQIMEDRADVFSHVARRHRHAGGVLRGRTSGDPGMHDKPVAEGLDPAGHFDGLRAWLCGLVDSGYVSAAAMDKLVVVDDVNAALAACTPR